MNVGRLVTCAVLAGVAAGCGIKGDPLPPLIRVADTTRDLTVVQVGTEAVLTWSYPSVTTAGGPLPDVEAVEVWRTTLPAGLEPGDATGRDREVRYQLLEAQGEILLTLDTAGLDEATRGPMLEVRDDLVRWRGIYGSEQRWIIWYSVRTICCRGRPSSFSDIARLDPQVPPSPPQDLVATPTADGVELGWRSEPGLAAIVERAPSAGRWVRVSPEPVTGGTWSDGTAEQGSSWRYRVRSVRAMPDGGQVIGDPGEEISISYLDVYPPAEPQNLVCLPEAHRVLLRWQSSADASWYRVERRLGAGPWKVIADRHRAVEIEDGNPPPGSITYSVLAIDASGNESDPATCRALISDDP